MKDYFKLMVFLFLFKIIEEFVNMLMFGFCFYGNIYVGEILLSLLVGLVIIGFLGIIGVVILMFLW